MSLLLLSDSDGLEAVGAVQGVSTATATGIALSLGAGQSDGVATVNGQSPSAVGTAAGSSTALGQNPTGTGLSTASANALGWAPIAEGTSAGSSTANGQVPIAVGNSAGSSATDGRAPIAVGSSTGSSTATGRANLSAGLSEGSSTATGWAPIATGLATGSSTATGWSFEAIGHAAGSSSAFAYSQFTTAVGFTQGTADAFGFGLRLFLAAGTSDGVSTASAVGDYDTGVVFPTFGIAALGMGLDATILERGLLRIARKQPKTAKDFVSELCKTYEAFAKNALPRPVITGCRQRMENALLPAISNPNNPRNQSVNALVQSFQAFWIGTPTVTGGTVTAFLGAPILAANLNRLFLKDNTTESLARQVAQCMFLATKQVQYIIPGLSPAFLA